MMMRMFMSLYNKDEESNYVYVPLNHLPGRDSLDDDDDDDDEDVCASV